MRFRLRWSDPEDEEGKPLDWRLPALVTATLVLNFWFLGQRAAAAAYWGSPARSALIGSALVLVTLGVFYLLPALFAYSRAQTILEVADRSLGFLTGRLLRAVCILHLIAAASGAPGAFTFVLEEVVVGRNSRSVLVTAVGVAATALLFLSAFGGWRASASQALFTNKLSLALMAAALIRIRGGWAEGWCQWIESGGYQPISHSILYAGVVLAYLAPLAFLAALFAHRTGSKRAVALLGSCGLGLPLALVLAGSGFATFAMREAHLGSPKLANLAEALWAGDPRAYYSAKQLFVAVTYFGVVRFAALATAEILRVNPCRKSLQTLLAAGMAAAAAIAWKLQPAGTMDTLELTAPPLVAAVGVLSADFVMRRAPSQPPGAFDGTGIAALVAGSGWVYQYSSWEHPWVPPAYAIALGTCLAGRLIGPALRRVRWKG